MALSIAQFDSELGYTHAVAVAEKSKVTCKADVAGSLNNKYFQISDGGVLSHHVWFDVNGAGVDPAPGTIAVPVAVATNASAATVATAVAAAVDALAAFVAVASNNTVTITNAATGHADTLVVGTSGFTVEVLEDGRAADERFVIPYADLVANPNPDLTSESDHFGYVWNTLAAGYRMTGMTFAFDGATKVVLVIGDVVKYNGLLAVANSYVPV